MPTLLRSLHRVLSHPAARPAPVRHARALLEFDRLEAQLAAETAGLDQRVSQSDDVELRPTEPRDDERYK